mgnify:CR=1 FL=1
MTSCLCAHQLFFRTRGRAAGDKIGHATSKFLRSQILSGKKLSISVFDGLLALTLGCQTQDAYILETS